jgi:hypothetical protein
MGADAAAVETPSIDPNRAQRGQLSMPWPRGGRRSCRVPGARSTTHVAGSIDDFIV